MTTAEIFKRVREEAGLSQVMLAQMVGATQGTISHIETSPNSNPTYDLVAKYVSAVGANPIFLFGIDLSAPPIIHPTVQVERMKSSNNNDKIKKSIIQELEATIQKLKSL